MKRNNVNEKERARERNSMKCSTFWLCVIKKVNCTEQIQASVPVPFVYVCVGVIAKHRFTFIVRYKYIDTNTLADLVIVLISVAAATVVIVAKKNHMN